MQGQKIDLDRTLNKNPLDKLIKLMQKLAKLISKITSKICKCKIYKKAVNNLINVNN